MKNIKLSKRTYLVAFAFVMMLNAFLAVFLFRTVLAQSTESTQNQMTVTEIVKQDKSQIKVAVKKQSESPLLVTIIRVNDSNVSRPIVSYVLQNTSTKAIKGFTVIEQEKTPQNENITATTIDYASKSLQPNEHSKDSFNDRSYFQAVEELLISIDYVVFEDGTSWGEDIYKGSETVAGRRAGRVQAIKEINSLINNGKVTDVISIMEQDITKTTSLEPNSRQTVIWQNGFSQGYRSVIMQLQLAYKKEGKNALSSKLKEMEILVKKEEK